MRFYIIIPALLVLVAFVSCEKVDQAFDAVNKVKTIKDDITKSAQEVKDDIKGKADSVIGNITKDMPIMPSGDKDKQTGKDKKEQEDHKE